tara:strand:+ start:596 stop:877 length:282 start_codon:yes stop_codon:yes gene_type:complete
MPKMPCTCCGKWNTRLTPAQLSKYDGWHICAKCKEELNDEFNEKYRCIAIVNGKAGGPRAHRKGERCLRARLKDSVYCATHKYHIEGGGQDKV